MRPPRLRLRALMIAVAAIALAIAWEVNHLREAEGFESRASEHAIDEWGDIRIRDNKDGWLRSPCSSRIPMPPRKLTRAEIELAPRRIAYHQALAEKYEWAARHPWMPLWPDPPEPE